MQLPICSCMYFTYYVRVLRNLSIVVLRFQSDNSKDVPCQALVLVLALIFFQIIFYLSFIMTNIK
jgi:hypothetical protein